jgi:sugar phosphate isomerase/epimerase
VGRRARPPVAVSTGVYSQFPDYASPSAVADGMVRIGAEAYEVLLFGSWPDMRAAARTIASAGAPIAVVHAEKRVGGLLGSADPAERRHGQELILAAVEAAEILGAPCVNVHVWDLPDSDRVLPRNLEALTEVLPAVWRRGIHLLAETIPCQRDVPWRNVQRVLDACDAFREGLPATLRSAVPGGESIGVNLDLEFLCWHGGLETTLTSFVPRWGARLRNVHVKDHDGQPFVDGRRRYVNPGDGRLDYPAIFRCLRDAGYGGPLTFEGNVTQVGDRGAALEATRRYLARIAAWADAVWGEP